MSLVESKRRLEERPFPLPSTTNRKIYIAVAGCGDWTEKAILPDLRALADDLMNVGHPGLAVTYLDLAPEDKKPFATRDDERYRCIADPVVAEDLDSTVLDIVIIATADSRHVTDVRQWGGRSETAKLILVEKPFSDNSFEIAELLAELKNEPQPNVWREQFVLGFDHYVLYASGLLEHAAAIDDALGEPAAIEFAMTETGPIESSRLRSLQSGLIFDMASHFLAILLLFATLDTDDGEVLWRGRHNFANYPELNGREYFAETAAEFRFTVPLRDSEQRARCYGRVGKALDTSSKFLRLITNDGRSIVLALNDRRELIGPDPDAISRQRPALAEPLEQAPWAPCQRHGRIVEAFRTGDASHFALLLDVSECFTIVKLLERLRCESIRMPPYEPQAPEWQQSWA